VGPATMDGRQAAPELAKTTKWAVKRTLCGAGMMDGGQAEPELAETRKWAVKWTPCGAGHDGWRAGCTRTSGNNEMGGEMDTLWGRPQWMAAWLHQN
jgi:hypothetical protein